MRRDPNFLIMARSDIRAVEVIEAAQDRARSWWRPAAPHLQGGVEELVQFQATSEGYEALERGVIDCSLQSTANGYNAGWLEVAPSSTCRERPASHRPGQDAPQRRFFWPLSLLFERPIPGLSSNIVRRRSYAWLRALNGRFLTDRRWIANTDKLKTGPRPGCR